MTLKSTTLIHSVSKLIYLLDRSPKNSYRYLIENLDLNTEDIQSYCTWNENNYTRNPIHLNNNYDLIILCWQQEQLSPVHDHGGKECFMYVVEGLIQENIYQLKQKSLVEHQGNLYKKGDSSYIIDSIGMHSISCVSQRAVTLHIYARPIKKYHIFDFEQNKLVSSEYVV